MKILHINSAQNWRGGEQQVAYLITGLKEQNIAQMVFCKENSAFADFCAQKQIPYTTYHRKNTIQIASKLTSICQKEQISLMHFHDSFMHTCAVLAADIFRNPVPFVVSRRVDYPVKKNMLSRWKYNHPKLKKILCVSEAIHQMYLCDVKNTAKVTKVYSGIDLQKFGTESSGILRKEFQIPNNTLIIGNIAAISPHKDYFTFVDTVEILCQENLNAKFLMIGGKEDVEETQKVEAYIQQKQLHKHIIMTGFRKDIPAILPELDIFLFTSKTEGLGTSLLDAFACKVPVVSTNAGGVPELVIHEKTGLLSPIKDAQHLANQVLRLVNEPMLKETIIQGALQHLKSFTKENTLTQTLKIYQEIST